MSAIFTLGDTYNMTIAVETERLCLVDVIKSAPKKPDSKALSISPNPIARGSKIQVNGLLENDYSYELHSLNGTLINSGKLSTSNSLESDNIKSGTYILLLIGPHGDFYSKKILIE